MKRREFRSTDRLKQVMAGYYRDLGTSGSDRTAPVAWCTSTGPVEILRALGFQVHFPENHSAILGASRTANTYMSKAHACGYSQDVCSYLTSDIGAYLAGETPLSAYGLDAVPRADVLVFNTNQCRDVRDWFEFYGREWDAGARLDPSSLGDTIELSRECVDLWRSCLRTGVNKPSPLTFFDGTIHMGPVVTMRGLPEACDYYRLFEAELLERVEQGIAAVEGERYRLYWDGMPLWGKLREQSELFAELQTAVVASTYCNSWIFDALDPSDPFRSLARASLELFIARSETPKESYIAELVGEYSVDGILFHDSRTCPNNSNARYGMPLRLRTDLNIPVITIEGDQTDLRFYSTEQAKTSIEGFVEQLEEARSTQEGVGA